MSSDRARPLKETSCGEFATIQTGVGALPVPPGFAGQIHMLHHNGLTKSGISPCRPLRIDITEPRRAPQTSEPTPRHHPLPEKPSPPSPPPPSGDFPHLVKQWERLLTWATLKTLIDFKVMPARPAREASRRLAQKILADYGPSLHNWLGKRT